MRLGAGLRITATATDVPASVVTTAQAIAAGRTDAADAAAVGIDRLPVAEGRTGPDLAVGAARSALAAAGRQASDLDLLVHAWTHHQGHDFWSPAHHVAHALGAHDALPVGVQQMCNGGAAAIETVATRLLADPTVTHALVTTGDVFADEGFDRWRSDTGVWYGDGGTACLLERHDGSPTGDPVLLSIASRAIPSAEAMHRGDDPATPAARWSSPVVSARRTKAAYAATGAMRAFVSAGRAALRAVTERALADAGLEPDDPRITVVTVPRVGRGVLGSMYAPALDGLTKGELRFTAQGTGHLGAGDLVANLDQVLAEPRDRSGAVGVFVSAGGGFTFSCAVVALGGVRA
jgi:3-oxoacyl-[acyl-carrier-protein] synthase-3